MRKGAARAGKQRGSRGGTEGGFLSKDPACHSSGSDGGCNCRCVQPCWLAPGVAWGAHAGQAGRMQPCVRPSRRVAGLPWAREGRPTWEGAHSHDAMVLPNHQLVEQAEQRAKKVPAAHQAGQQGAAAGGGRGPGAGPLCRMQAAAGGPAAAGQVIHNLGTVKDTLLWHSKAGACFTNCSSAAAAAAAGSHSPTPPLQPRTRLTRWQSGPG